MDRDVNKLAPSFKAKVERFMNDERIKGKIFITEAFRTQERQEYLYNQVPKVTWTLTSNHTKGLAIDIAFNGDTLYPNDIKEWLKVSEVAKEYGIDWGYDLWGTDKPHFQDNNINKEDMEYRNLLKEIVKNGYDPIFNNLEGERLLSEGEVKALIEIAIARTIDKIINNIK